MPPIDGLDPTEPSPFVPSPSQQTALDKAMRAIRAADLVLLEGDPGTGRSSLVRELQARCGGAILTMGDLMVAAAPRHARRMEQTLFELLRDALEVNDVVYFDSVRTLQYADRETMYNRHGLVSAVLRAVRDLCQGAGKCFVAVTDHRPGSSRTKDLALGRSWDDKGLVVKIPAMTVEDYRHILAAHLGADAVEAIDLQALFRESGKLSARQLTLLSRRLLQGGRTEVTNARAFELLAEMLASNVDLDEVEAVALTDMVGVDPIIARLDRAILLPLRDKDLARELKLEPKHGVLLYGPPGTGKTTVGRALAHQMQGKFFMIDGDIVHDALGFYKKVDRVFEQALRNSPSVIFIDDADVILGDPDMQHFGRYLLTKLDGLQSESMAKVCVMMTAMNIASMPPAMLRSGRLEVWLEMRLPEADVRADMIDSYARKLPFAEAAAQAAARRSELAEVTDGFTPADLRRVVLDAASRLGFDRHRKVPEQDFGAYLGAAAQDIRAQKGLAEAAIRARGGLRYH